MNKRIWQWWIAGWAAALLLPAAAGAKGLAVITGETLGPYREAQEAFEHAISQEVMTFNLKGSVEEGRRVFESLADKRLDAVVLLGISAVRAAQQSTPAVPIIYTMVIEPQALPDAKKVAGLVMTVDTDSQFSRIRKLLPSAKTAGVLYNPADSEPLIQKALAAAEKQGLKLVTAVVKEPEDAAMALQSLEGKKPDLIWSIPDKTAAHPQAFAVVNQFALDHKLPLIGISEYQVRAGAFAAFSVDYQDMGRQTADLVERLLGKQLQENVILEYPRLIITFINMETSKALGIADVPAVPNIRMVR
ncbi:MAG: ABC transporter substrate binding protein [candidate division FCPU426 bacterium]